MNIDIILGWYVYLLRCHFYANVFLGVCLKGFEIISSVLNPTFQILSEWVTWLLMSSAVKENCASPEIICSLLSTMKDSATKHETYIWDLHIRPIWADFYL